MTYDPQKDPALYIQTTERLSALSRHADPAQIARAFREDCDRCPYTDENDNLPYLWLTECADKAASLLNIYRHTQCIEQSYGCTVNIDDAKDAILATLRHTPEEVKVAAREMIARDTAAAIAAHIVAMIQLSPREPGRPLDPEEVKLLPRLWAMLEGFTEGRQYRAQYRAQEALTPYRGERVSAQNRKDRQHAAALRDADARLLGRAIASALPTESEKYAALEKAAALIESVSPRIFETSVALRSTIAAGKATHARRSQRIANAALDSPDAKNSAEVILFEPLKGSKAAEAALACEGIFAPLATSAEWRQTRKSNLRSVNAWMKNPIITLALSDDPPPSIAAARAACGAAHFETKEARDILRSRGFKLSRKGLVNL